jgi:hypothetical protein
MLARSGLATPRHHRLRPRQRLGRVSMTKDDEVIDIGISDADIDEWHFAEHTTCGCSSAEGFMPWAMRPAKGAPTPAQPKFLSNQLRRCWRLVGGGGGVAAAFAASSSRKRLASRVFTEILDINGKGIDFPIGLDAGKPSSPYIVRVPIQLTPKLAKVFESLPGFPALQGLKLKQSAGDC